MGPGILEFGEFHLDCERFELRRKGIPLRLERQPMELLMFLASSGGRLVTRDEIARRLWDTQVFVDTEHGINTAIRKIRHTLREDPDNPRFLQTVTGKGYRFVGVTATQPTPDPAPPHAPSVHPDGLQANGSESPPNHRLWLVVSAFAVAILLIAITVGVRNVHGHTAHRAITSIAVLPLDNLTGDPAQNYLADGMTDELTTQLARDSTLRVISRTSVMQYKGARRPLPQIARALNVDGILEGSLDRAGNQIHMTVQLIYAPTDTHVWAQSYDRGPDDLVTFPQEAALTIAKETHSSVAAAAAPKYVNPAAHDAYLRGRYLWFSGHELESGPYFIKATQLQPDYALAWYGLACYYGATAVEGSLDPRQAVPLSKAAALRTVQLDPSLPESHFILATVYWLSDWNLDAALRELDQATAIDPGFTEGWHIRSKILIQENRFDEGVAAQRHAMEINQFERPWALTFAYLMSRHYDDAIADAKQRLEGGDSPVLWWFLERAYAAKGMNNESEHALEQVLVLTNDPLARTIHRAYERGGKKAVLHIRIEDLRNQARKHYVSPYRFAWFYAQLGDKQHTLAYLDESIRQHSPLILDVQDDYVFDFLHSDPHYRAIVQKTGLPPAW